MIGLLTALPKTLFMNDWGKKEGLLLTRIVLTIRHLEQILCPNKWGMMKW